MFMHFILIYLYTQRSRRKCVILIIKSTKHEKIFIEEQVMKMNNFDAKLLEIVFIVGNIILSITFRCDRMALEINQQ